MASDFNKNDLDVERHYTSNWFTIWASLRLLKHDLKHQTSHGYNLAQWLMGFANMLRSASPRDGYEWVDRRKSKWSQMDDRQKIREIDASLRAVAEGNDLKLKGSKAKTKGNSKSPSQGDTT